MVVTSAEAATHTSLLLHGNKVRGRHLQKQTKEAAGRQNKTKQNRKTEKTEQYNKQRKESSYRFSLFSHRQKFAKWFCFFFLFFFCFQLEENERKEKKKWSTREDSPSPRTLFLRVDLF